MTCVKPCGLQHQCHKQFRQLDLFSSMMEFMNIDDLIAQRVRELRKQRGLTLEQLADHSGVSRSMISLIERQETSPTAAVLNKLADALGVTLPALFAHGAATAERQPLAHVTDQPIWTDPASGYMRRHVSPANYGSPIELVEVRFPPGQSVTFESATRSVVTHQQVWMLEGSMQITVGEQVWRLKAGDCLAMELGPHVTFHNPTRQSARYALAVTTTPRTFP